MGLTVSSLRLHHINLMGCMPRTGQPRCPGAELGNEASACVYSRGLVLQSSAMTGKAFLSAFLRVIPSKQPPLSFVLSADTWGAHAALHPETSFPLCSVLHVLALLSPQSKAADTIPSRPEWAVLNLIYFYFIC